MHKHTDSEASGCKPGSVLCAGICPRKAAFIYLSREGLPPFGGATHPTPKGRAARDVIHCLAPSRVFHARSIALAAVGSYPAFSPLPVGGLFSAALFIHGGLPPAFRFFNRGFALRCPDFPLERNLSSECPPLAKICQRTQLTKIIWRKTP